MVKTTYALTLFTAVSMAAPLRQSGGSGSSENFIGAGSAGGKVNDVVAGLFKELIPRDDYGDKVIKHGSIFEELPLIGPLFGSSKKQRRSFTGDLAALPLLGELFGGNQAHPANTPNKHEARSHMPFFGEGQNYGQNYGQNAGQNAHQNEGQNHGQNYGQNEGQNYGQNDGQNEGQNHLQNGQNHKQDLDLSSLPIIGKYLGGDGKKFGPPSSHTFTQAKAEPEESRIQSRMEGSSEIDSFANPFGESNLAETVPEGVTGASAANFRAGLEVAEDAIPLPVDRRDLMQELTELAKPAEKQDNSDGAEDDPADKKEKSGSTTQAKPAEKSNKPPKASDALKELAKEAGLDQLFSKNTQHGVGLLPMNGRRDTTVEARTPPIQGATLTDVLLQSGALGKLSHMLDPYTPAKTPGQSDPTQMGDGSSMAPPGQPGSPAGSGAAGPHDGPGYAAEHAKTQQ